MSKAEEIPSKHPSATRNGAISLAAFLDTLEVVSGTPTIAATPTGLTFSDVQSNSTAVKIKGKTVAIGKAIQFSVSGGSSGVTYKCECTFSTNSTPPQTEVVEFPLAVLDR